MTFDLIHHPDLINLRKAFLDEGFDLRLVGGCVRDMLMGIEPKDIDLCTDADPNQQITVFKNAGIRFFETGLSHGTITVVINSTPYEITSLRTESEHDGRHATVAYTRDWNADLGRRDLTINAMALTFDGFLIDPFNGQQDLAAGKIRFVGNPNHRMQEDFLRILRWFRFHGRIAPSQPLDEATRAATQANAKGLEKISRERVWSEVSRILVTDVAPMLIDQMGRLGVSPAIDLPNGSITRLANAHQHTRNPVTLMAAFIGDPVRMQKLKNEWKWSNDEGDLAMFLVRNHLFDVDFKRLVTLHKVPVSWIVELAVLQNRMEEGENIKNWEVPQFPLDGNDVMNAGVKRGPGLGEVLKTLKQLWATSDYKMTKEELLAKIEL